LAYILLNLPHIAQLASCRPAAERCTRLSLCLHPLTPGDQSEYQIDHRSLRTEIRILLVPERNRFITSEDLLFVH
jgi:hypothetical protein